jgi:hypothetical protein
MHPKTRVQSKDDIGQGALLIHPYFSLLIRTTEFSELATSRSMFNEVVNRKAINFTTVSSGAHNSKVT